MIALVGLNANAAIYLVGTSPLGNGWDPSTGVEMKDNGDGTYSYVANIDGDVWFCFADGLDSNWDVFNGTHRYGPTTGGDQTINPETWTTTQKQGNGSGSYKFHGSGDDYTVIFDLNNLQFIIKGYVEPITYNSFTVCGNNAAVFGDEWNPANTDNDMTLDATDGLYKLVKNNVEISASTLYYKVAANHAWGESWGNPAGPDGNQDYVFNENGTYNLTFMFNFETKEVSLDAVKVQDGPEIDPYTGNLYMVGEVNDNAWNPSTGIAMTNAGDDDTFTLANAQIKDSGDGYGYFSFMAVLGEGSWPADGYRIGAAEDATLAVVGENNAMGGFGTTGAFKLEAGYYNFTVVLSGGENGILMITAGEAPEPTVDDVYIIGDVNNIGWSATEGVKMAYNEGIYTAQITTQNQGDLGVGYFGFTKKLADAESETDVWEQIAAYRFGPVSEDAFVMTEELLNVNCDLATDGSYNSIAIPAGTWTVTVDLVNNKFAINGEWPSVEPEHYDGDVYIMGEVNDNGGWFTNKGVKMTRDAENNVYTATITTAGENEGYSYFSFTKQLAEGEADWEAIAPYRFGAVTDGNPFLVTEELLNQELALVNNADPRAFQIEAGEWNLTLSVDNMKLVITKVEGKRGDVNGDDGVNIADVTALIDYLLSGNTEGVVVGNADCNVDQAVNIADVTALIDYLLSGSWAE